MNLAAAGFMASFAPLGGAEVNVSVFASGQPVREVLQKLSDSAQLAIVLDPGVRGDLDLALKDVPFTTALSAICRSLGAEWKKDQMEDEDGRKLDVYRVRPVRPPPEARAPAASSAAPVRREPAPAASRSSPEGRAASVDETSPGKEEPGVKLTQVQLRALVESLPDIDVLMMPRSLTPSGRLPVFRPLSPGPAVLSHRPYLVIGPYGPYFVYPHRSGREYSYRGAYIPRRYLPARP